MANPTKSHLGATKRVLKYLKGCPNKGLYFKRNSPIHLIGFSDADWATCVSTRRSVTSYCFFIGNSLISWKTKKQNIVSRSSSEAEYRALATSTYELQWLTYLLTDLKIQCSKSATLYCDNQSALHTATNPVFHERTKHLEIDCHLVQEKAQAGLMKLLPVPSFRQRVFPSVLHSLFHFYFCFTLIVLSGSTHCFVGLDVTNKFYCNPYVLMIYIHVSFIVVYVSILNTCFGLILLCMI
uniref:Copia protein n=1 Tax=Cajanus cajan TaxID=3821 RepID=A0A151TEJ8_CAJCA|nr:Copia protein [Cajanus cajan]